MVQFPGSGQFEKKRIKEWLEEWGAYYTERDIRPLVPADQRNNAKYAQKALVIKGGAVPGEKDFSQEHPVIAKARRDAEAILKTRPWPRLYFGHKGATKPMLKVYEREVKAGSVPTTFWAEPDTEPVALGATSWPSSESGRSREGLEELKALLGDNQIFETVKPLKLFTKILQIWCPHNGIVLDPFAGSGTTGHAVLVLNEMTGASRRFILIEQGRPEKGDTYARSLTAERLKRAITGQWANGKGTPLGGGFEFRALTTQIDANTVLSMKKDDLVDVVITSHWETGRRSSPNLIRIEDSQFTYLVGKNQQDEGYFIIWNNGGPVRQLDAESYNLVLQDAKKAGLKRPYHVYARYEVYQSKNVRFYKIPDKILAHLGLNEDSDAFNPDEAEG